MKNKKTNVPVKNEVIRILGDDGRELVSLIIHSPTSHDKEVGFNSVKWETIAISGEEQNYII